MRTQTIPFVSSLEHDEDLVTKCGFKILIHFDLIFAPLGETPLFVLRSFT